MGYAHEHPRTREVTDQEWEAIAKDFTQLLQEMPDNLLEGVEGWGNPPIIGWDYIRFNGRQERCETFILDRHSKPAGWEDTVQYPYGYSFTKTRQRPYDLAVCAALILADHHAPKAWSIGSDGNPEDWLPALTLVREVLGSWYDLPACFRAAGAL